MEDFIKLSQTCINKRHIVELVKGAGYIDMYLNNKRSIVIHEGCDDFDTL